MQSICLSGRSIAAQNERWLKERVSELIINGGGRAPCLAAILVGDHKPSRVYVRIKQEACARVGIESITRILPSTLTTRDVLDEIESLNQNPRCHGILLQHPVPAHIDELRCFDAIDPNKDVDGVSSVGYARLCRQQRAYACATPRGIERLLSAYQLSPAGLDAVVIGRGPILGTPMAAILTNANATVTVCHSHTRELKRHVERAQLIVAGIGRARFIPGQWIADGAVVIDAGYNPDGSGDIDLDIEAKKRCRAYTPVPGGVGPMTVNTLLNQTFASACQHELGTEAPPEPTAYDIKS